MLFEVELLHNTTVNNLLVCNLLLDGLTNEFASYYGDYFYGLHYKWVNDGVKLMEEGSVPNEMYSLSSLSHRRIYLLDGRLHHFAFAEKVEKLLIVIEAERPEKDRGRHLACRVSCVSR